MDYDLLQELDESAFAPLLEHLSANKVAINKYRTKVGPGRSQCFGMVRKRSMAPDLSRQSWMDPKMHWLLMRFALDYLPCTFRFTSIQVNENYKCAEHKDIHNDGLSYIVGFGQYTGGDLMFPETKQRFNIRHRPMLFNGSNILHSTDDWTGCRYSFVYHTLVSPPKFPMVRMLMDYPAMLLKGEWVIQVLNIPGQETTYLKKGHGLPHPLKGRKKKAITELTPQDPSLTEAQNLLASLLNQNSP